MAKAVLAVAIDQGNNLRELKTLQKKGRIKLVQARDLEQTWPTHVQSQGRPFTIGISIINGLDRIAGNSVDEVKKVFGEKKEEDFLHVYSAFLASADYFVTSDKTDFINNGRREVLEQLMPNLKIRTTDELLIELEEGD